MCIDYNFLNYPAEIYFSVRYTTVRTEHDIGLARILFCRWLIVRVKVVISVVFLRNYAQLFASKVEKMFFNININGEYNE